MEKGEQRWNLDDILKAEEFDALYVDIEKGIETLKAHFKEMSPDMSEEAFKKYALFDEELEAKHDRLYIMPAMMEDTDMKSEEAKLMKGKAKDLALKMTEIGTKIGLWLQGKEVDDKPVLDDENAKRLFSTIPDLEYTFTRARDSAKYSLSEAEENIITAKDLNGLSVLKDLRKEIETEFKFEFKPRGLRNLLKKKKTLTLEEIKSYVYSSNPEEREGAYKLILSKYKDNINKFFMIYQAVVKDWTHFAEKRGHKSSIACRNHSNDVPDEAVETLLEVCSENKDIFQDYFRWKAKELGMKKLRRFDIYAPLESKEQKVSYKDGEKLVLETLAQFSEGFAEKARQIINAQHIDTHPREGKSSGAYCWTATPNTIPYVLLNYTGKLRDVSVLAHELGHGIHSLYAKHHFPSSFHANLPLSETASTFSEMVIFEKLFAEAESDEVRKSMLSEKLSDSYATILRQSKFVEFEIKAHEAIQKGVTAEELSDIYLGTLTEQFGDAVDVDPLFRYEWAHIPHIVKRPFYCYAYSFGDPLSRSLYSRYKKEGKKYIPKIEKTLAYGGSKNPQRALEEADVDMCSKEFWQGSFDLIKEWQRQLESY